MRQGKEIKGIQTGQEVKLPLFGGSIILRNPPKIKPINEFSKVEGYTTNLQK